MSSSVRTLFILLCIGGVLYVAYEYLRLRALVAIGISDGSVARPFSEVRPDGHLSILVLGDSLAVGQGASPETSVAGRLGALLDASVENHAKGGAKIQDVLSQCDSASHTRYDLILIQAGANDIMRFTSLDTAAASLEKVFACTEVLSDKVVLMTAGDIGRAPFWPRIVAPLLSWRTRQLRERFMQVAAAHGVEYVDLYTLSDPFSSEPTRYYAKDFLHLSGEGYGFWFEQLKSQIMKRWPSLYDDSGR